MRLLLEKFQPQMDVYERRWKKGLKMGIWSLELKKFGGVSRGEVGGKSGAGAADLVLRSIRGGWVK